MRRMRELRRNERLKVRDGSIHGGYGEVTINGWIGSVVWGNDEDGWEHVSVSPYNESVTPSWDDMCQVKDIFFDDEEIAIQIHPKKSEYVNAMKNCLHLWRPKDQTVFEKPGRKTR